MKRFFALIVVLVLLCDAFTCPVTATCASGEEQIIVSQTIESLGEDCYFIETVYLPLVQSYANTKTGTKTAQYIASGITIYTISVTGIFTYDGSTSCATSASGSIATYVDGVTINSRRAYTSGASACAFGSVSYNGATLQKTVTLTCDKDGNLS